MMRPGMADAWPPGSWAPAPTLPTPWPVDGRASADWRMSGPVCLGIRRLYPHPDTPQYGCIGERRHVMSDNLPSEATKMESWGWACLSHVADDEDLSFADSYLGPGREAEYLVEIDGWELTFWPWDERRIPTTAPPRAAACFDLRKVRRAEARPEGKLWSIVLCTRNSKYSFVVGDEDIAQRWVQRIRQVSLEWQQASQKANFEGQERARSLRSSEAPLRRRVVAAAAPRPLSMGESLPVLIVPPPKRERALKRLWAECVAAAPEPAPEAVFSQLFQLYDVDGDQDLALEEMLLMLGELLTVRSRELEKTEGLMLGLRGAEARLILDGAARQGWERSAAKAATKLRDLYGYMQRSDGGLTARASLIRSQMDLSCDGRVSLGEFLRDAPRLLLPPRELRMEAAFYSCCERGMDKARAVQGLDDDSDDEGGAACVLQ